VYDRCLATSTWH